MWSKTLFAFGICLASADEGITQDEAVSLLQTKAVATRRGNALETEFDFDFEADEIFETFEDEDDYADIDNYNVNRMIQQSLRSIEEHDETWAHGYKRCRDAPWGAHSKCKHVGGGRNFAADVRTCALRARQMGGDTFQFIAANARCWIKTCDSVNIRYGDEPTKRPWLIYSDFCGLPRVHRQVQSDCGQLYNNFLRFPPPTPVVCSKALTFQRMKNNNLNNYGPGQGSATMRFASVLPGIDLVIESDTNYRAKNSDLNGVWKGAYGRINMLNGSSTNLAFTFVEENGRTPVKVDNFVFTVFDVDQGRDCTARLTVVAHKFTAYHVAEDSELAVHTFPGSLERPATSYFTSTQWGTKRDNPQFPMELTPEQAKRVVSFEFRNVKSFKMGFGLSPGKGGRNLLFGGLSSVTAAACPGS